MPKAYSYVRFSRPEQMRGDSLRRQTEAANRWAADHNLTIDETLTDLGVSAFRGKNRLVGALSSFLRLVEAGRIERGSYLIVESLDRLSREAVIEILPRFMDLINAGITVVTLADGQEYSRERLQSDAMPLIMSLVVMIRAHEESRTKSLRSGAAWRRKKTQTSEGVVATSRVPAWLTVEEVGGSKRIVEIRERVEIVRRIFRETIRGYGRRRIVERLNLEGVPTFGRGDGWHASYIKKILENPAVLGHYQPLTRNEAGERVPDGPVKTGYYPCVVSETEFLRANSAKSGRVAAPGRRGQGVTNILQGLVRCACGATMKRLNKGPKPRGGSYLVCSRAQRKVVRDGEIACGNLRRWRLDDVEAIVLSRTARLDLSALMAPDDDQATVTATDLAVAIESAQRRRARLLDLVEEGDEEAVQRARALASKIKEMKAELATLERAARTARAEPSPTARQTTIRELLEAMKGATGDERTELRTRSAQELRALLTKIEFAPHAIQITYRTMPVIPGVIHLPGAVCTVEIFNDDQVRRNELILEFSHPESFFEERDARQRWLGFFARRRQRLEGRPSQDGFWSSIAHSNVGGGRAA